MAGSQHTCSTGEQVIIRWWKKHYSSHTMSEVHQHILLYLGKNQTKANHCILFSFYSVQTFWNGVCLQIHTFPFLVSFTVKLTTVLIFFFPSEALMRHLLSAGSYVSGWPFLGTGFVLPSSGKQTDKCSDYNLLAEDLVSVQEGFIIRARQE